MFSACKRNHGFTSNALYQRLYDKYKSYYEHITPFKTVFVPGVKTVFYRRDFNELLTKFNNITTVPVLPLSTSFPNEKGVIYAFNKIYDIFNDKYNHSKMHTEKKEDCYLLSVGYSSNCDSRDFIEPLYNDENEIKCKAISDAQLVISGHIQELPDGTIETPKEAMIRELGEEIGIKTSSLIQVSKINQQIFILPVSKCIPLEEEDLHEEHKIRDRSGKRNKVNCFIFGTLDEINDLIFKIKYRNNSSDTNTISSLVAINLNDILLNHQYLFDPTKEKPKLSEKTNNITFDSKSWR